jgi:hypothetical protein
VTSIASDGAENHILLRLGISMLVLSLLVFGRQTSAENERTAYPYADWTRPAGFGPPKDGGDDEKSADPDAKKYSGGIAGLRQKLPRVDLPVRENVTVTTPRLGPVGGRIVAEVFLGLMFGDPNSLLRVDPKWKPESGSNFALEDVVNCALGK